MEEMTRRADFISKRRDAGLDTFSVPRPSPRRPEDVPGFALPNQHVALVAMGTEASPPCPVDAEAPTLCVYGVFASVEEAKEHSDLLSAADPTCSLYAVQCREWVLMPRLSSGSDEAALEARRDALVEAHARAVLQEQRAFDARREAFKATGRDDAPRSFAPARDPSDESTREAEELVYAKLKRPGPLADVRGQRYVCLCVIPHPNGECLFQVLGCFDSSEDASAYARDVASQCIVDADIAVHATCAWMLPNTISNPSPATKTWYRHTELQNIMDGLTKGASQRAVRDFVASDLGGVPG